MKSSKSVPQLTRLRDTRREKAPSNKTCMKSMNIDFWVVGTSNQLFTRSS